MRNTPGNLAALLTLITIALSAGVEAAPRIVTTIKPLHSIASSISQGVSVPQLLVPASRSPHNYQLRVSQARALASADLVIRVGDGLERFLLKALPSLAAGAHVVTLVEIDAIRLHRVRRDFDHDDEHSFGHAGQHPQEEGQSLSVERLRVERIDYHLWLDPDNAVLAAAAIAHHLSELDPANALVYQRNYHAFESRLVALVVPLKRRLQGLPRRDFLSFHDSFQYFEHYFGLRTVGVIALHPGVPAGAARLAALRRQLIDGEVSCLFSEPQFAPDQIEALVADSGVASAVLDPLGVDLEPGPDMYFQLLSYNADVFSTCLGQQ